MIEGKVDIEKIIKVEVIEDGEEIIIGNKLGKEDDRIERSEDLMDDERKKLSFMVGGEIGIIE